MNAIKIEDTHTFVAKSTRVHRTVMRAIMVV